MEQQTPKNFKVRLQFDNELFPGAQFIETFKEFIILANDPRHYMEDTVILIENITTGPFRDAVKELILKEILISELQVTPPEQVRPKLVFSWTKGNADLPFYHPEKIMDYLEKYIKQSGQL